MPAPGQGSLPLTRPVAATPAATPGGAASPVAARHDLLGGRPPIVWSLSLLFAFKSIVAFAVVAFPLSPAQPTDLFVAGGALSLVTAGAVWLAGSRIPTMGFELLAAVGALATSALVARAQTTGGMLVAAFAYTWIAMYAAHFFPRRVVNALGVLITVGLACGLALDGLAHPIVYWCVVTATIWAICTVLGGLSEGLRRQVRTDQLTGTLNRAGFAAAALRERVIADRSGAPLVLAAIDLDDFKQVNDRYGHAAGDRLLATLARSWRARLRPADILGRHGGDEFVLLLPSTSEAAAADALARLRGEEQTVGWSAGISEWLPGEQLSEVLARADERLYGAKLARQRGAAPGRAQSPGRLAHAPSPLGHLA